MGGVGAEWGAAEGVGDCLRGEAGRIQRDAKEVQCYVHREAGGVAEAGRGAVHGW